MAISSDQRGIFLTRVIRRRTLCCEHFEVTLGVDAFPSAEPGQFVQVLCRPPANQDSGHSDNNRQSAGPLLRRPFSIAGLRRSSGGVEIDLLGRVIGSGTAWLASLSPDDSVDILGPIGRPFTLPEEGALCVLLAGGVGLPPIRWLGEILRKTGQSCVAIYGARTRDLLPVAITSEPDRAGAMTMCVEEFAREGIATAVTTDDGSCGLRGRVTDALRVYLDGLVGGTDARVFGCGPEPMLRAIAAICRERDVSCEAAMERVMGCGMGTCQSCVVPVKDASRADGWRYALCCSEGPVFDAARVIWPRIGTVPR